MGTSSSPTASAAMPRPLQRSNSAAPTARAHIYPDTVVRKADKHCDPDGSTRAYVNTNFGNTSYLPIIQTDVGAMAPAGLRGQGGGRGVESGPLTTTDMVSQHSPV